MGTPLGTVRASLDAYGSTSETAERHIFQRGHSLFDLELVPKRGLSPLQNQAVDVSHIALTMLLVNNTLKNDVIHLLKRQPGDGTSVLLTIELTHSIWLQICISSSKQGIRTPVFPVLMQSRIEGAVRALDLLKAESVELGMGQERDQFARRSVRRRHGVFLSVHHRETAIGFACRHFVAPTSHPFAKHPQ